MLILLQTTDSGASGGLGGMEQFLFFGGIIAIFYFFMIRPQQKKAKEERQFRENLNKGDKVITIGGIHGQVESIDDKSVLVKVDTNVKLRFDKTALRPLPAENEKPA
ncbi:MAG: preprotein translocase subunit YajC [Bacteroidia bacterium]|nr:preprotein translocase subunit YajC [Bacteroidia bacterium]